MKFPQPAEKLQPKRDRDEGEGGEMLRCIRHRTISLCLLSPGSPCWDGAPQLHLYLQFAWEPQGPAETRLPLSPSLEFRHTLGEVTGSNPHFSHICPITPSLVTQGQHSLWWFFTSEPLLVCLPSGATEMATANCLSCNKGFIRAGGPSRSQTPSHRTVTTLTQSRHHFVFYHK